MRSAFILREQRGHIITPLPHLGLFCSRNKAKKAARHFELPFHLIYKVTRNVNENA
jgi:hypothetical protein